MIETERENSFALAVLFTTDWHNRLYIVKLDIRVSHYIVFL